MNEYRQNKSICETIRLVNTLDGKVTRYFWLFCLQLYIYVPVNSHFHPTLHLET